MIVVGIDPGKTGGIGWINGDTLEAGAATFPTVGKDIDLPGTWRILQDLEPSLVIIEKQQVLPKNGSSSNFQLGRRYGELMAFLAALQAPHEAIRPQAWKKEVLAGTAKDKAAAIQYVTSRFPLVSLFETPKCRKPHDGMADALCLAEYGRRIIAGGGLAKEAA